VFDASKTAWVLIEDTRAVQDAEYGECEKTPSCRTQRSCGAEDCLRKKTRGSGDANDLDLERGGKRVKRTEESVGDASPQQPPRPAGPEYTLFLFSLFALTVFASFQ
jgi:hypothetical protein